MKKDKRIRDFEIAISAEMFAMPCLLILYRVEFAFWALLILLDCIILKRLDVVELWYFRIDPQRKTEQKTIDILLFGSTICMVFLFFRSPSVAGILIVNEFLIVVLSLFQHGKSQEK